MRGAVSARALIGLKAGCLVAACTFAIPSVAAAAPAGRLAARQAFVHSSMPAGTRPASRTGASVRPSAAPTVSSISVGSLNQDESTTGTIHGTGFVSGARVSLGRDVSTVVTAVTPTVITVRLAAGSDAKFGWRILTVTEPSGEKGTLSHAVHVDYRPVFTRWAVGDGAVSWATSLVRPTFTSAPTLGFSGAGVSVASETVTAGGRLDVSVTIASGAHATWRTMTITEGSATWTVPHGLKVRPAPMVTSVAPLGQGATNQNVRVTGSNFEVCKTKEPLIALSGTGVSVDGVSSAFGNLMYVRLTVAPNAPLGAHDMTVTNCNTGGVATSSSVFHVVGPPTITSIAPIAIGVRRIEVVSGTNLTPATTLSASGTGVTFSHLVWISGAKMRATIDVALGATLGARDVTASDTGGATTLNTGVLTIDPLPTETSVSPRGIGANTAVTVTIFGTGFQTGATVSVDVGGKPDAAVLVSHVVVDSATKLQAVITATAATALAAAKLTVTNPDGGAGTLGFTTDPGPKLHVTSSTTTQGAVLAVFTAPAGAPANEIYDIAACTNAAMSTKCVQVDSFKSGRTLEGLVPGTRYFVAVSALASGSYFASRSAVVGPYRASLRLQAPVITKTAATSTTIRITFKGSSNAPANQSYTARVCLNAAMTQGCLTRAHYRSGVAITGVHKAKYFVQIFAVASPGFLPSSSKVVAA